MEIDELIELDSKKAEEYGKINNKYLESKKKEVNILDYYQEITLNAPYSSANSTTSYAIKPYQLLPFFKTVIVDILPLPNEELFKEYYGMSVEELIELEQKGKAIIRLPDLYEGYKKIESDYLDPILSQSHPSSFLINSSYGYLLNNKIAEELEESQNLFKKDFDFGNLLSMEMGITDPMVIASSDIINGSQPYMAKTDDESYKKLTHNNINRLSYSGYSNVNSFLKEILSVGNGRLDWAFTYSTAYTSFLADPILSSLNGTHMTNYNMKEILNDLILRTSSGTLRETLLRKSNDILCYDIGKTLTDEVSAPLPFNLEESLDYDYEGAINALKSLERVIDEKNKNEIIDLTTELKNKIYEAGQIAKDMRSAPERNAEKIESISTVIGFIGELGEVLPEDSQFKPLLDVLKYMGKGGEIISKTQTLQKAIERVVKFNKPDHVLYLYNNYEYLPITPKSDSKRISKRRWGFKGELYEKYMYYDHIYKKIPIIRVIIDITARLTVGERPSLKVSSEHELMGKFISKRLNAWHDDYLPNEKYILLIKHLLLYGKAYYIKETINKNGIEHINPVPINPKFVRAIYKNKNIIAYEIINMDGKKKKIGKKDVIDFDFPKNVSIIENHIPMLDIIYPEITRKDKRPKLLYDIIYENLGKNLN